jgi:hypothetical protein
MASLDLTWIFGSSRSGSSWLLRMLRRHPDVVGVIIDTRDDGPILVREYLGELEVTGV